MNGMESIKELPLKISGHIAWQEEQTEKFVYIFDIPNNRWFYLNDVSKDIWLLIDNKRNINEIANELSKRYDVEYNILFNDIKEFINDLFIEGIIS